MASTKVCMEAWQGFRLQDIEGADPARKWIGGEERAKEEERLWNILGKIEKVLWILEE